ncbi:MAG: hypothetical protein ABII82_01815 [Verrucomicrobiota bacterium]
MKNKRLHWAVYAPALIVGITALGAVVGAVVFPLWGLLFGLERGAGELAMTGARTLGFYFLIWAPGIALVLCVKRAYEAQASRERQNPTD